MCKHCSKSFICVPSLNSHKPLYSGYFNYSYFIDGKAKAQGGPEVSGYLSSLTPEITLVPASVNCLVLWTIPLGNKDNNSEIYRVGGGGEVGLQL